MFYEISALKLQINLFINVLMFVKYKKQQGKLQQHSHVRAKNKCDGKCVKTKSGQATKKNVKNKMNIIHIQDMVSMQMENFVS